MPALARILGWMACACLSSGPAQADEPPHLKRDVPAVWDAGPLGQAALRLSASYAKVGSLHRMPPRLLEQETHFPIVLPAALTDPETDSCATVAVLASTNLSFLLLFADDDVEPARRAWPIPSAAGAAEVTRCGARKALLSKLGVRLRSRRGVFEFIALESENPPAPLSEILPARNPDPGLPSPQVGRRPWLAPLKSRVEISKDFSARKGADSVHQSGLASDAAGRGSSLVHLAAGCHRLELLSESDPESPPDLDAHLFTLAQGTEVASDEEHSGQVALHHCVGRPERLRLDFSGARPHGEVTLIHAAWSIPEAFPLSWGPIARAGLARAAFEDGLHQFQGAPMYSSLGVRGTTHLSVEIDPTACYTAVAAPIRGEVRSLALGIRTGSSTTEAQAGTGDGVSVSFCAQHERVARFEVSGHGAGLAWILGLWRMGAALP